MGRLSKKDMEELREACSYDCGYTDTEEVVKDITAQVLEELDAFRFHRRSRSPLHRVGGWSYSLDFTVKDGGRIRYTLDTGFSCFDGYDKPCITGGYSVDDLNRMGDLMKEIYYYLAEHGSLTYTPDPAERGPYARPYPYTPSALPESSSLPESP